MSENAKLNFNNKDYEFHVVSGSENEKAIDVSTLRTKANLITIDPGFKNKALVKFNSFRWEKD